MSKILFIKRLDQLEAVRNENPHLLHSSVIVALSSHMWLAMREAGFSVYPASGFLTKGDFDEIRIQAREMSTNWFDPFCEDLVYKGFNLGELQRIENMHFFCELLATELIARRITDAIQPSEVYVFSEQKKPCLGSERCSAEHDVSEAVFQDFFQRVGKKVNNLAKASIDRGRFPFIPVSYKRRLLKLYRSTLGFRRESSPDGNSHKETTPPGSLTLPVKQTGNRLMFGIAAGIDLYTLAPFLEMLSSVSGYTAMLVNREGPIPSHSGRSGIREIAPDQVIHLIASYPSKLDETVSAKIEIAKRKFNACRRQQYYGAGSPLNNRLLDFHFNSLWCKPKEIALHIDRLLKFFKDAEPDGVIVSGCEVAQDRATVQVAKSQGIRTFAIPHGYIGDVDCYDFEVDHFLAWGQASRDCLVSELGKQPEAIELFGPVHLNSLPFDNLVERPARPKRRLLLLTNRSSPLCFDPLDVKTFEATWDALGDFVKRSPDVELIIKPHPPDANHVTLDYVDWYDSFCRQLPSDRVRIELYLRVEEMMGEIDAVVAMLDASTAILVCQLYGIPSLFIRSSWLDMPLDVKAWGLPDGIESVDKIDEIAPALERVMFDEDFRRHSVERGQILLENNLKPYGLEGPQAELRSILDGCFAAEDRAIDSSRVCA